MPNNPAIRHPHPYMKFLSAIFLLTFFLAGISPVWSQVRVVEIT